MSEEAAYILCGPMPGIITGAAPGACVQCGVEICVSPSTTAFVATRPDVQVVCLACGGRAAREASDQGEPVRLGVAQVQLREILVEVPGPAGVALVEEIKRIAEVVE